jgi:hypothetical protein
VYYDKWHQKNYYVDDRIFSAFLKIDREVEDLLKNPFKRRERVFVINKYYWYESPLLFPLDTFRNQLTFDKQKDNFLLVNPDHD